MSSLRYMKGVRTRHYNTLKEGVNQASFLLQKDIRDKEKMLKAIEVSIEKMELYVSKLENQTGLIIEAVGEQDEKGENMMNDMIDEDNNVCDSAVNMCSKLELLKTKISEMPEEEVKEDEGKINMQSNMFNLLEKQMELQKEILANQQKNAKTKGACSVKLPKLELVSFSGNRLG